MKRWLPLLALGCTTAVVDAPPSLDAGFPVPPRIESPCVGRAAATPNDFEVVCGESEAGHFLSVWGSGPDDVYVVGGRPLESTAIWRYDGRALAPVPVEGTDRAWWVFGFSADDVIVVGERGLGLRKRGGRFERFDTGTTQTIYGAWGPSPERVYFVSGGFGLPGQRGLLHVLTSSGAEIVRAPALDAYEGQALFKVWGRAADDVYVAGDGGAIFHFDGVEWSRMATPSDRVTILTLSGGREVYGVGGRGRAAVWRLDGAAWVDATPAGANPGLMGVHAGVEPVLVSGENGFLAELVDGRFHALPQYTTQPLHAVWRAANGDAWAVGGNLLEVGAAPRGVILRRAAARCAPGAISGAGFHHLDLQGRTAAPKPDGRYSIFDVPRGFIHPELVHGEHYVLGLGSVVEWSIPLCADLTGELAFRMPNNDEAGAFALHQLFLVRDGREVLVAEALDMEAGDSGYNPFNRSSLPAAEVEKIAAINTSPRGLFLGWAEFARVRPFDRPPRDVLAKPGDTLLFRVTNVSDLMYGLMVWFPQNGLQYQAFLEIHVPERPGGEDATPPPPPPPKGPCAPASAERFIELGRSVGGTFSPYPPAEAKAEIGPQGSLMFLVGVRGRGFLPGDVMNPLEPTNPYLGVVLSMNAPASRGGRIIADGFWRRGFTRRGEELVLDAIRPTVPVGAAELGTVADKTVHAELFVVTSAGETLCQTTSFTARR